MVSSRTEAFIDLRARVERSIDALNRGDPGPLLSHYRDDVRVRVPLYRPDDPIGETEILGKSAFRDFLLRYLASHQSYQVRDIHPEPFGMLISLECAQGDRMTVRVTFDEAGLGANVTVYVT